MPEFEFDPYDARFDDKEHYRRTKKIRHPSLEQLDEIAEPRLREKIVEPQPVLGQRVAAFS